MLATFTLTLMLAGTAAAFDAQAAIKPVADIVASVRTYQSKQPPPANDAERIVRLGQLDQAVRSGGAVIPWAAYSPEQRVAIAAALKDVGQAIDRENQADLLKMLPADGWFLKSRYGEPAAKAAALIVLHSEMTLLPRFVPVLEPLVARGEVDPGTFALMYDRLAVNERRAQRYGSQFKCEGGRFIELPLESSASIDELRASAGMGTYAAHKARYVGRPC